MVFRCTILVSAGVLAFSQCTVPVVPGDGLGDAGSTCLDASVTWAPFSVCKLANESQNVVYARFSGYGAPVPFVDGLRHCERDYQDIRLVVSRTIRGPAITGDVDVLWDPLLELGPLDASVETDGIFFIVPIWPFDGGLALAGNGGYFWTSQGNWVDVGAYAQGGLSTAEMEDAVLHADASCTQ
jgi:hypothetical protein